MSGKWLVFVLTMVCAGSAWAQAPSYSYFEAQWLDPDFNDGFLGRTPPLRQVKDSDGYAFSFYAQFHKQAFFFTEGRFMDVDMRSGPPDDRDTLSMGVGARSGVQTRLGWFDYYATLSAEGYQQETADSLGWGVGMGVRWLPVRMIELRPKIKYADYGNLDEDFGPSRGDLSIFSYGIEAALNLGDVAALTIGYVTDHNDVGGRTNDDFDVDTLQAGVRVNF